MGKIDTVGTYRGPITEHSLGFTKNKYPQFVARFQAAEKWVEDPSELEHFQLEEPQWVDWSPFNESVVGFMVLFNDPDEYTEDTKLLNYEQLQLALGWDGTSFTPLGDNTYVNHKVLFRIDENEYNGQVRLQVNWVDDYDASPVQSLKPVKKEDIAEMNSKLQVAKKAKAKPVAAAKATKTAKPKTETAVAPKAAPVPTKAKPSTPPPPAPASSTAVELPDLSAGTDPKIDAWEFIIANKGDNENSTIEEAWIAACDEVGADEKDDDQFTVADWQRVLTIVVKDLALMA